MKLVVFGASGGTGREVVQQALQQNYETTAFVRHPALMEKFKENKNFQIIQGDVLNPQDVVKAIKGQDVVISVLGNKATNALFKKDTTVSQGLHHIVAAMQEYKVKRIIFVASFGVNKNIFLPEKLFLKMILKNLFADIPFQEKLLRQSGLDWTLVHPARLTNDAHLTKYKVGENLSIGPFSHISRVNVASFLIKEIVDANYIHKKVTITS